MNGTVVASRFRLGFDRCGHAVAARLGEGWWRLRRGELALYTRLGVPAFARWFYNGGSHGGSGVPFYRRQPGPRQQRLRGLDAFARCIEAKHLVGVAVCSAVPLAALALDRPAVAALLALANLVGHGYPIMSMRYVRARAGTLLARHQQPAPPGGGRSAGAGGDPGALATTSPEA